MIQQKKNKQKETKIFLFFFKVKYTKKTTNNTQNVQRKTTNQQKHNFDYKLTK
jgi:hypothetical protein